MNALTEPVQFLRDAGGRPAFAVLAYDFYQSLIQRKPVEPGIPSEVVDAFFYKNISATKAWREYLSLTQAEMCKRLSMTQGAYSQLEAKKTIRKSSREKIASALGIDPSQLDF
jgi:DNA-binding XRE family transcriptional regulator